MDGGNRVDGRPEVHLVAGTRPEAIKLAPVARELARAGRLRPVLVASGQHPAMVAQSLRTFGLCPHETLAVDRRTGSQPELYAGMLPALDALWARRPPAAVVVQGDTATTVAGALAAFWRHVPVVHLEAGLRSHDLAAPFPEEANRKLVGTLAALHLAPTERSAANLAAEGVPDERIQVIGNTVVDAVRAVSVSRRPFAERELAGVERRARSGETRLALVTVHRRESWGAPMAAVLRAVRTLVRRHPELEVVLPAHPNPAVRAQVTAAVGGCPRVLLTDPLDYADLARLLGSCTLVLSDSGGIQEEAPTFGVPVLVLRELTERQEAVDAGCARLVGTDENRIVTAAHALLTGPELAASMVAAGNPFGDGRAALRTEQALARLLGLRAEAPEPFLPGAERLVPA
ncbi:non-hydrolyzing UDP-N-acetylglucosamine 2-epimerase [Amycolatopsis anabasis]|uniref:non-hydrolyzing UDP-N-acetylglucosamine 2-epimerase n=1 Tax=Amycolatopsis anabasis TaxID=1840409 RepID=UPI00131D59B3|nr:UDP-N-acetylglucosamine 2-epimerase (non-hydrolyzing) [Amycolatopsis anabasis]